MFSGARGSFTTALSLVALVGAGCAAGGCQTQAAEGLAGSSEAIIGGKLDTTHKGVVSVLKLVQVPGGGSGFYSACSGTLLTQNLVLTAHHCVAELTTADGSVECSTTKFKANDAANTFMISIEANVGADKLDPFRVSQVWTPDGSSDVCGNDIALLMLTGAGVPASAATPIEPRLASPVPADDTFAAIGYGLQDANDDTGDTAGHRMAVTNATVTCQGSDCGTPLIEDDEFIAKSPVCSGDSGGPALDSAGHVAGVTSRGDAECTLGIYSSVASWREFIVSKTLDAAKSGNYTPPAWAGDPTTGGAPSTGGVGGAAQAGGAGTPAASGSSSASGGTSSTSTGGKSGSAGSSGSLSSGASSGSSSGGASSSSSPLGTMCTGQCDAGYKCWAESGKPPGICVPACSAAKTTCPTDYSCDTTLNACTKVTTLKADAHEDSSCSVSQAGAPQRENGGIWLGLSLMAWQWTQRRGAKRAAQRQPA
ncbi:MAG TPA: trypsin-like serine protease [Polyangiaceae bacterium]|nr:trypsin-like serine protease [Polyangiaceae bacterium]